MKPFVAVSASQTDVHMRCKRRWYFEKILGITPPQHPSAALGEQLHAMNEQYLLTGEKPTRGTKAADLFYAGLGFLPQSVSVQ
jgi:CRISPR/Cas system-associated exonuclease Cas4 (RecB family)